LQTYGHSLIALLSAQNSRFLFRKPEFLRTLLEDAEHFLLAHDAAFEVVRFFGVSEALFFVQIVPVGVDADEHVLDEFDLGIG